MGKEGGVSHRFNREICSARVEFTHKLQRSKRVVSAIDSIGRSAQLGWSSLTYCNGQRGRCQPSIQEGDLLSWGGVHSPTATAKEGGVSHRFNREICSAREEFTYSLQRPKRAVSAIDSIGRSAQLGWSSLTICNGQRGRCQPSIQ